VIFFWAARTRFSCLGRQNFCIRAPIEIKIISQKTNLQKKFQKINFKSTCPNFHLSTKQTLGPLGVKLCHELRRSSIRFNTWVLLSSVFFATTYLAFLQFDYELVRFVLLEIYGYFEGNRHNLLFKQFGFAISRWISCYIWMNVHSLKWLSCYNIWMNVQSLRWKMSIYSRSTNFFHFHTWKCYITSELVAWFHEIGNFFIIGDIVIPVYHHD
jgi:hypothetical protein